MKKASIKLLAAVLTLCLILSGAMVIAAATTDLTEASKDGVRVTLSTDKDTYGEGEQIAATLTIENGGSKAISNVKSVITLPPSLVLSNGSLSQTWDKLIVNARKWHAVGLKVAEPAVTTAPAESTTAPTESTTMPTTENGDQIPTVTPETGDGFPMWMAILVMVVSAGGLCLLLVTGKLKLDRSFCLLLFAALLVISMVPVASSAEETVNQIQVSKTVSVGGTSVTIAAVVTYDIIEEPDVITRADMETALAEVAWDHYLKDVWFQYDSADLNSRTDGSNLPMSRWVGGFTRLSNYLDTLEDMNAHDTQYSVCSYFPWAVYYEALDYPLFGNSLNSATLTFWYSAETPQDMCIIRYHNWDVNEYSDSRETGVVKHDKCVSYDELCDFIRNWEENLRPGDVFYVIGGHAAIYIGNGMIMESGGGKYSLALGTDTYEASGTVLVHTIEDYFFNKESGTTYFLDRLVMEANTKLCILRPLNLLTVDDGDGNPDNDVLNEEYELDTGRLKFQLSRDPNNILKKSGYTIQDSAYSRMKYPAMNINRTVNITPYGTAVKGDTITYTVAISNQSNDTDYVAYHSAGTDTPYAGQAYTDLPIDETVPANTTLVSCTEGAVIVGNNLHWEIDVPAGQTVEVSYTVRVTGEIGDKIVNGDGWVDNIPSNTITNTIGGAKLSADANADMHEFFTKDVDYWNSNDGYRISASVNEGTHFAERIYNEAAGLDLQLPDIQELMDMLFTQELIEEEYGMYLQYANTTTSRYMYTLNDTTADPANQIYRDMLIDGYYGGIWVYTNIYAGQPRTDELRLDYLEAGDILVYMNLTQSPSQGVAKEERTVDDWQVIVYLGNEEFASLKSSGKLQKLTGTDGVITAFTFDMFVALRPSQVYEDLNTQIGAYSGPAPELTEEDAKWVYTPNISNVLLGEKLSAKLAAMTPDDGWGDVTTKLAGEIYSRLGVEAPEAGFYNSSFATFLKILFIDDPDSESESCLRYYHEYTLIEEPEEQTETEYEMLLYYGGPTMPNPKPVTSLSDLHPGDILSIGLRRERYYVCAVYQGNGNFLAGIQNLRGGMYYTGVESRWVTMSFASDAEFLNFLSAPIDATIDSDLSYEAYMVLRPSRVYEDINLVKRDIKDGPLTEEEINTLASLTIDDWTNAGLPVNLHGGGVWMYSTANINVSAYFNQSVHSTLLTLFDASGGRGWERKAETNDHQTMLLNYSWGGYDFAEQNDPATMNLEIGDVFCGRFKDSGNNVYWTALYQGGGNFLVVQSHPASGAGCFTATMNEIKANDYSYYYVLRPEQLATTQDEEPVIRDISTGKLTDAEETVLAALTPEDWTEGGELGNLNFAGVWMYSTANIDVSNYLDKSVHNTLLALFDASGGNGYVRKTEANDYQTMLLDNSWGGSYFPADTQYDPVTMNLKIGDIFCGRFKDGSSNVYWTALYQGNGNFLAQQNHGGTGASCFIATVDELKANAWQYYYVLRPEQLATTQDEEPDVPEEPVVRDIVTSVLTDAEKAALAALTPEAWDNYSTNLNGAGVWMYSKANIDVSAYFNKTIHSILTAEFDASGGNGYVRKEQTNVYQTMLLDNSWGGRDFADDYDPAEMNLEIGDIFCGRFKISSSNVYWTALYQGNGNFLVVQNGYGDACCFVATAAELMENAWHYYYVLRPEQLAESVPVLDTFVMKYDDRMPVTELGQTGEPVIITMTVTSKKVGTDTPDAAVLTYADGKLIAVGVGTASVVWITEDNIYKYNFTVEPADISLLMVTGHSLGAGSNGDGAQSIICKDGQVYSTNEAAYTFKLTNGNTNNLTVEGIDVTGMGLGYGAYQPKDLSALNEAGAGVRGIDGALAYRWHQLTGEKVWILNASKGSTSLQTWKEGGFNYRHAVELFTTAEEILYNEVQAGHYIVNKMGIVNYTTANGDETWSPEEYTTAFNSMWEGFQREMALYDFDGDGQNDTVDCIGLLPLWNPCAMGDWNNLFPEPLAFYASTGDMYYGKLINYSMSAYEDSGVIMASVAGRSWTSDANVAAFFAANPIANMYGKLQDGTTHTDPTTMQNGVYGDGVHYCQLGYNVQGIETAESMYEYWYGNNNVTSVTLLQANGVDEVPETVVIPEAGTYVVVPVATPSSAKLAYTVTGDAVSYSGCLLTAEKLGNATLTITDRQGNVLKTVNITVGEDSSEEPVIRDIATGKLTDAEKAALAALTPEAWDNYSTNLNGAGVWMYSKANIDVSAYFNKTIHSILTAEFDASGGNGYVRKEQTNVYQTMLLDNSWGGRDFADDYDPAEMNLEIGDIFCGRFKISSSNVYWTALYQGNGNFLVVENGNGDPRCFVATAAELMENAWHYYYVLRPDNLAS